MGTGGKTAPVQPVTVRATAPISADLAMKGAILGVTQNELQVVANRQQAMNAVNTERILARQDAAVQNLVVTDPTTQPGQVAAPTVETIPETAPARGGSSGGGGGVPTAPPEIEFSEGQYTPATIAEGSKLDTKTLMIAGAVGLGLLLLLKGK
jgi:hypothetical protein